MKSPFKKCIGIDPGKGGGLTVISNDNIEIHNCPKDVNGMAHLIGMCLSDVSAYRTKVVLEKVWAFPTDGRVGSFTFGENYGQWQGILASHEIEPVSVTPKAWQSHFNIEKGLKKDVRKKVLKQIAIDRCPNTKKIREAIEKNQDKYDEEQRVWYVGVTRTKQNLYIMTAKREDWGYDI